MTTETFAATHVSSTHNWIQGTRDKKERFTLQMPTVWTAAGQAWDISGYFTYVTEFSAGVGTLVTDFQALFGLFGTTSGNSDGAISASTVKVAAYGTQHGTSADDVLAALPDSTDLDAIAALTATVHGF